MAVSLAEVSAERNSPKIAIDLTTLNRALAAGEHALALYIHIATKAAGQGRAALTIEQLCDLSDLSKNTIKKYLQKLEDRGLIQVLQKGQWRGLPTVYSLEEHCHLPDNIVNFVTEKGSNDDIKGSNSDSDPWHAETEASRKGSIDYTRVNVQGVNDSKERGQRQRTYSPTPPSSSNSINNTTTTGRAVDFDFTAPEFLAKTPEVLAVRKQYPHLTDDLVLRSIRTVKTLKFSQNPPKTARMAAKRAAGWLRTGEEEGIHGQWRREDPYGMAGVLAL